MATKIREIRELADYIRGLSTKVQKATARALMRTAVAATGKAKRNARDNFKGSRERPKSGFLVNAIFAGFSMKGRGASSVLAEAYVAVRSRKGNLGTRPYGRIHEYGGEIVPRTANNLWLPQLGPKSTGADIAAFKNMTPRDFMKAFLAQKKGKSTGFKFRGKRKKGTLIGKKKSLKGEFAFLPGPLGKGFGAFFVKKMGRGKTAREKFYLLFLLRKKVFIPPRPYVRPAVQEEFEKFKERLDGELARGKKKPDGGSVPPETGGS